MTTQTPPVGSRKLTVADIADVRQYERERAETRARLMEMKRRRRVSLGTIITVIFENRETVRYQIQEMARVEHLTTDEAIQEELDAYNPLVPEPGELCATLFVELTSDDQLREWLPKLVGIEQAVQFRLAGGEVVRAVTEAQHASQLTRADVTAAVHYVQFSFTPEQVAAMESGPVHLELDHPAYRESVELASSTVEELLADLHP